MTSVPGSSVLFRLKRDKGLMRDGTEESSRQTLPDTNPSIPFSYEKQSKRSKSNQTCSLLTGSYMS